MDTNRTLILLALAGLLAVAPPSYAQETDQTVHHNRGDEEHDPYLVPALIQAEKSIDLRDFITAENKLRHIVSDDDQNYRAWFDLGYVYTATRRDADAIEAYRKAVAAKPDLFEANLNLGILLGEAGNLEAEKYLRAATGLKPSGSPELGHERAWLSLAHVLESKDPQEAAAAYREAAKLAPGDVEPHLAAGIFFEKQNRLADAEREYQQAVELDPKSVEGMAGLVNVYTKTQRLPEVEKMLRRYLELNPQNQTAHLQLGRVLAARGNSADARAEYETVLKLDPNDLQAQRELAALDLATDHYSEAAQRYQALVARKPADPELHYALGSALLHARDFPAAQQALIETVKLKPDLGEAYGDLALAASENKQYELAIRALDWRAKFLPETPGTYFLRATSYDNLKAFKQAAENYRKFLEAAQGKFPDQEWQARHRLIAIDPDKKK
ncbi:MAG: tetratricopeptide repeat protein [Terriglobales bacterium]